MSEHDLQLNCIAWFRNQKIGEIVPVPNEATYKNKTFVINKGCSDLILFLPNRILFVELKVGRNIQSLDQIKFQQRITQLGYEYHLIRTFEDFKTTILQAYNRHERT